MGVLGLEFEIGMFMLAKDGSCSMGRAEQDGQLEVVLARERYLVSKTDVCLFNNDFQLSRPRHARYASMTRSAETKATCKEIV